MGLKGRQVISLQSDLTRTKSLKESKRFHWFQYFKDCALKVQDLYPTKWLCLLELQYTSKVNQSLTLTKDGVKHKAFKNKVAGASSTFRFMGNARLTLTSGR